jgi:hypothetical protein
MMLSIQSLVFALASFHLALAFNISYPETSCVIPFNQKDFTADPPSELCYSYIKDKSFSKIKFSLYHLNETLFLADEDPTPWFELLEDVADRVLPKYSDFLLPENHLNIRAYIVEKSRDRATWEYAYDHGHVWANLRSPDTCYFELPIGLERWNTPFPERDVIRNKMAHHLYHCIQLNSGQVESIASHIESNEWWALRTTSHWWYEGAADFFGDALVRQKYRTELGSGLSSFGPWNSLCGLFSGNEGGSFFLHLAELGWSYDQINALALKQTFNEGYLQEHLKLSEDLELVEAFHSYAAAFVDKNIKHNDGTVVNLPYNSLEEVEYGRHKPYEEGTVEKELQRTGRFDLEARSIPLYVNPPYNITLPPGAQYTATFTKTYKDQYNKDPNFKGDTVHLQYRIKDAPTGWSKLSLGDTIELNGAEATECPSRNVTYSFLATSSEVGAEDWEWKSIVEARDSASFATVRFVDWEFSFSAPERGAPC